MRILIFSDSHTDISLCTSVITKIGADMIIHAGDHAADAERLANIFPDIPVKYVKGNCDFSSAPSELKIQLPDNKKIYVTHGHTYNVKSSYLPVELKAEEVNADMVVFGHTHIPYNLNTGRRIFLNPGSIKYSGTFAVAELDNGKLSADILIASDWM